MPKYMAQLLTLKHWEMQWRRHCARKAQMKFLHHCEIRQNNFFLGDSLAKDTIYFDQMYIFASCKERYDFFQSPFAFSHAIPAMKSS